MGEKYTWSGTSVPVIDVHSVKKHDVLREYLKQYILIVGGRPIQRKELKITFVDAFSGGGLYQGPNGEIYEGSPLIFLSATEEAAYQLATEKPFQLKPHYIFIDKEKQSLLFLRELLEKRGFKNRIDKNIFLNQGLFDQNISQIIKHIKKRRGTARRCIFFLDQYGYSDVPLSSINYIFKCLPNAEVILTFYVDFLIDYLSNSEASKKALQKTNLPFNLESLPEIKKQKEWRRIIQRELYLSLFEYSGANYLTNFFIKSNESRKSYWLLHLSMHPTARNEMQKLHWKLKNHFCHEGKAGLYMLGYNPEADGFNQQQDFLFTEIDELTNHKTLIEEIPAATPTRGISFYDFVNTHCNLSPSTTEMFNNALKELYADEQIQIFTKNGNKKRRHSTINQDDVIRREPQKMFFLNFN